MPDAWKSYRGAPSSGTRVCAAETIPDPGTLSVDIAGFPLLLVRRGKAIDAFVNACPHQYLPLTYKGDKLISADGRIIRCTNHQAGFLIDTGAGVEGLGIGCELDRVPVVVSDGGDIVIG